LVLQAVAVLVALGPAAAALASPVVPDFAPGDFAAGAAIDNAF
jgi:hypothetical protein